MNLIKHIEGLFARAKTAELQNAPNKAQLATEAAALQELNDSVTSLQSRVTALESKFAVSPQAQQAVADTASTSAAVQNNVAGG